MVNKESKKKWLAVPVIKTGSILIKENIMIQILLAKHILRALIFKKTVLENEPVCNVIYTITIIAVYH